MFIPIKKTFGSLVISSAIASLIASLQVSDIFFPDKGVLYKLDELLNMILLLN